MKEIFKEIYNYRELLKTSIQKDIRGKYKASFLGVLWSFLNPLLQLLVYTMVFSVIVTLAMRPKLRRIDMVESLKSNE